MMILQRKDSTNCLLFVLLIFLFWNELTDLNVHNLPKIDMVKRRKKRNSYQKSKSIDRKNKLVSISISNDNQCKQGKQIKYPIVFYNHPME